MNEPDVEKIVDDIGREVAGMLYPDQVVRRNCAFCGRERAPKDDNHAPDCFYWQVFLANELGHE